jgi:hypothetical protein
MSFQIQRVDYFYTMVQDRPGAAYELLNQLAELGISLLAFAAVPTGPTHTQLTLFPEDGGKMKAAATQAGFALDGPHPALLVRGDDELGALAGIHAKLSQANIKLFASTGVTDGKGSFGYVLYLRPEACEEAAKILGV